MQLSFLELMNHKMLYESIYFFLCMVIIVTVGVLVARIVGAFKAVHVKDVQKSMFLASKQKY